MDIANQLYKLLPVGFQGNKKILEKYQTVPDIMRELMVFFNKYKFDYDYISPEFYSGNLDADLQELWNFCKDYLQYVIEDDADQKLQSPASILYNRKVDCKCYSLFIAGILDSWERLGLYDLQSLFFVFGSYDGDPTPGHVFIECNGLWIDPVMDRFNQDKKPTFTIKRNLMLYSLSGTKRRKRRIGDDEESGDDPWIYDIPDSPTDDSNIDTVNEDGSIDYTDGSTLESDGTLYDENDNIIGYGIDSVNSDGTIDYQDGYTLYPNGVIVDDNDNQIGEGVDSYNPFTGDVDYNNGTTLEGDGTLYGANDEILSVGVVDYDPITGNIDYNDGYTVQGNGELYDSDGNLVATDVIGYNPGTGVVTYDGGNIETIQQINSGGNTPGTPHHVPGTPQSGTPQGAGGGGAISPPKPPNPPAPGTKPVPPKGTTTKSGSLSSILSGNTPIIILGVVGLYLLVKK
jgi:hypothetical protein